MEAEIKLEYGTSKEAKAVSEAISPDNIDAPAGLSIQTFYSRNTVTTIVRYGEDNVMTFLSTIDDVLRCVSTAEKALISAKKAEQIS
ncbi:hypothetical protein KEJ18_03945 [Candidatus Bathyarchaeota archaeon]|nr:hypothetical protein [Candidatus Bathyarchaeota archaeon]